MFQKLVECVPNFSEGRDKKKIDEIVSAISSVNGVKLLDVDIGYGTNRTVVTFAGEPEAVLEGAFRGIEKAYEVIDMSKHKGEHPRQGACDVCPFVPVSNVTMEECIHLANRLGERVGRELKVPVYLYAMAAKRPERTRLPDIREGEYEALPDKLKKPEWAPDYGPARFDPKFGALTTGARHFLIAYNVNLNTKDVKVAKEIAGIIREKGRIKKDEHGNKVYDADGNPVYIPGLFKHVQADGWFIPEYKRAQVTINILNLYEAPIHNVYEAVREEAEKRGVRVTGSEIVGLVPKAALVEAGRYYLKKQGRFSSVGEMELIETAVISMGLSELTPFDIGRKVIEYNFKDPNSLLERKAADFVEEVASISPTPGGGSVSALLGSLAAALTGMAAGITYGKSSDEGTRLQLEEIGMVTTGLKARLAELVDRDAKAFDGVLSAMRLPKKTDEERTRREEACLLANKEATLVPLDTMRQGLEVLEVLARMAGMGDTNVMSDIGVAALAASAAIHGAYYNVIINLGGIGDEGWKEGVRREAEEMLEKESKVRRQIDEILTERLLKKV